MKRYDFYRGEAGEWSLVFYPTMGQWCIELVSSGSSLQRFTLEEFENGAPGQELVRELNAALLRAQLDA